MKRARHPQDLILDMWAYGCTAGTIAQALQLKNHKVVARTVDRARSKGDKRAVIHAYPDGRAVGRVERANAIAERLPDIETVSIIGCVEAVTAD